MRAPGLHPPPTLPPASPCLSPSPTLSGVLNRAEWVKFVGLFFNREKEASQIFEGLKAEYLATKASKTTAPVVLLRWCVGFWCRVLCFRRKAGCSPTKACAEAWVVLDCSAARSWGWLRRPRGLALHRFTSSCRFRFILPRRLPQAAAASSAADKPVVAWASHFVYPGSEWPGGAGAGGGWQMGRSHGCRMHVGVGAPPSTPRAVPPPRSPPTTAALFCPTPPWHAVAQ